MTGNTTKRYLSGMNGTIGGWTVRVYFGKEGIAVANHGDDEEEEELNIVAAVAAALLAMGKMIALQHG